MYTERRMEEPRFRNVSQENINAFFIKNGDEVRMKTKDEREKEEKKLEREEQREAVMELVRKCGEEFNAARTKRVEEREKLANVRFSRPKVFRCGIESIYFDSIDSVLPPETLTLGHLNVIEKAVNPFNEVFKLRVLRKVEGGLYDSSFERRRANHLVDPDSNNDATRNAKKHYRAINECFSNTIAFMEPYRRPDTHDPLEADMIELFGPENNDYKNPVRSRESLTWNQVNDELVPFLDKKIRKALQESELPETPFQVMVSPLVPLLVERDLFSDLNSFDPKKRIQKTEWVAGGYAMTDRVDYYDDKRNDVDYYSFRNHLSVPIQGAGFHIMILFKEFPSSYSLLNNEDTVYDKNVFPALSLEKDRTKKRV